MEQRGVLAACVMTGLLAMATGWMLGHHIKPEETIQVGEDTSSSVETNQPLRASAVNYSELQRQIKHLDRASLRRKLPRIITSISLVADAAQRRLLSSQLALALSTIVDSELSSQAAVAQPSSISTKEASPPDETASSAPDPRSVAILPDELPEDIAAYMRKPAFQDVALSIDRLAPETSTQEISRVVISMMRVADPQDKEVLIRRLDEKIQWLKKMRSAGVTGRSSLLAESGEKASHQRLATKPKRSSDSSNDQLRVDPGEIRDRITLVDPQRDVDELKQIAQDIFLVQDAKERDELLQLFQEKMDDR